MVVRPISVSNLEHYSNVTMDMMASQITSLMIVYSTVYSRRRSKKTSKLRVTGLCAGNSPVTGEFPAQRASNAENGSIWWRHHRGSSYRSARKLNVKNETHGYDINKYYIRCLTFSVLRFTRITKCEHFWMKCQLTTENRSNNIPQNYYCINTHVVFIW